MHKGFAAIDAEVVFSGLSVATRPEIQALG